MLVFALLLHASVAPLCVKVATRLRDDTIIGRMGNRADSAGSAMHSVRAPPRRGRETPPSNRPSRLCCPDCSMKTSVTVGREAPFTMEEDKGGPEE